MLLSNILLSLLCRGVAPVAAADEDSFTVQPSFDYSNLVAEQVIMVNETFGNSWSTPSDTPFVPTTTDFNRVVLELHVVSTGANYDRLAQLFIDDIEIWRSSTAEPDNYGTSWTVYKDVSHYGNLFKTDRTVNFLIANRVTDVYTGVFYVTLTARYYNDEATQDETDAGWIVDLNDLPDTVKALAKGNSSEPSDSWYAPSDDIEVSVGPLDRSVNRAVVHIFASGSGDDEFWWDTEHGTPGPSRFVELYVGGTLAGFAAPYPVIYTGGVNPDLWKPLVDVHTFDVPAYFIDITPFLPTLWDSSTEISINVTNGIDDSTIPSSWIITYNLLTWSDSNQTNSGSMDEPQYSSYTNNDSSVLVNRSLVTSATLNIGGSQQQVKWEQEADYNNTITGSTDAFVWQATSGTSSVSGLYSFDFDFSYPFQCEMNTDTFYRIQQSYDVTANGNAFSTWIDTSVTENSGTYNSSYARQYLTSPDETHFAETKDMEIVTQW